MSLRACRIYLDLATTLLERPAMDVAAAWKTPVDTSVSVEISGYQPFALASAIPQQRRRVQIHRRRLVSTVTDALCVEYLVRLLPAAL